MIHHRHKKGFTLIELMAALAAVSVLILAMGSTLIWLIRGERQSTNANESFNRADIIRDIMHTNLRTGQVIRFPTADATVAYPADGGTGRGTIGAPVGERVWVELQSWNPALNAGAGGFEIIQTMWTWVTASQTLTNQWEVSTANGAQPSGAVAWSQSQIQNFDVIRVSSRRIRFVVDTTEVDQAAQSNFTVTLRNIP